MGRDERTNGAGRAAEMAAAAALSARAKAVDVTDFDVMREMMERGLQIGFSPAVQKVQKVVEGKAVGTRIEIGIGGDWIRSIAEGETAVVMFLWDRAQFRAIKERMIQAGEEAMAGAEAAATGTGTGTGTEGENGNESGNESGGDQ